jgi:hypothetical protein
MRYYGYHATNTLRGLQESSPLVQKAFPLPPTALHFSTADIAYPRPVKTELSEFYLRMDEELSSGVSYRFLAACYSELGLLQNSEEAAAFIAKVRPSTEGSRGSKDPQSLQNASLREFLRIFRDAWLLRGGLPREGKLKPEYGKWPCGIEEFSLIFRKAGEKVVGMEGFEV